MTVPTIAMFVVLIALMPTQARADCAGASLERQKKRSVFVFEGTVKQIAQLDGQEFAADIQTHRVWKGKVPTTTTVHFVFTLDGPHFKEGERFVIFGVRETAQRKEDFPGLKGEAHKETIWVNPCTSTGRPTPEIVQRLGRSHKPS